MIIKAICLVARFLYQNEVHDEFLGLLKPDDFSAGGLFNVQFFLDEIPYITNMVGFASDGVSVMFGNKNSVVTRFKEKIPNLFVQKCICHYSLACVKC